MPAAIQIDPVDRALDQLRAYFAIFDPIRFRTWAELGLTTAQLRLMLLVRSDPGVTAGELANRLSVTPPTISGIVDRLVRLGLVRREDDESDRRLVRNHLTEKGEDVCGCTLRGSEMFNRRILSVMDPAALDALNAGLVGFIRASETVMRDDPDIAVRAMPTATS